MVPEGSNVRWNFHDYLLGWKNLEPHDLRLELDFYTTSEDHQNFTFIIVNNSETSNKCQNKKVGIVGGIVASWEAFSFLEIWLSY